MSKLMTSSESEYVTGDTSIDIHSPGPTTLDLTSNVVLGTFSRGDHRCRECITVANGVWEETVLINVSSSS